jgi:hypothetical protein
VYNSEKYRAGLIIFFFDVGFEQIGERNVTGFIALDQFACPLIYSNQVVVFKDNFGKFLAHV